MQKVSLWFPTMEGLFSFNYISNTLNAKIVAHKNLLIGWITKKEIELACINFNAIVLKLEKV